MILNRRNKSRESWLYSPLQLSPVDHGEKSVLLANLFQSTQDMPKLDLLDLETFINLPTSLVNPLEVHHQTEQNSLLMRSPVSPAKECPETVGTVKGDQAESSCVFQKPKATQKLKLEMEVFGDLSGFCQSTRMMAAKSSQSVVDELNTPVFEKAPFDYDRPTHSADLLDVVTSTEDPFNFKIKTELSSIDNVNIEDNLMITEDNIACKEGENTDISSMMPVDILNTQTGKPVNNYIVISSQGINTNSSNVFIPNNSEYEDIYHNNTTSDKVTPFYKELINEDDEYLPTVNNCSDIFFNNNSNSYYVDISNENSISHISDSSTQQYIVLHTAPFETPDNSRSASDCTGSNSPNLRLDINKKFKNTDVIDTPDVIDTIDEIENEKGFNILNFITDEDIHAVEPALTSLDVPVTSSSSHITAPEQTDSYNVRIPAIPKYSLKRKAKKDEDDDEDYVPPSKRRAVCRKTIKMHQKPALYDSNTSDDEEEEEEEILKPARRGRPPKRNISVSSEDASGDGKYREMRDKNNEASRKSRLKRKLKEVAQEDEAKDLEDKNTKLKAQVEQLERTVTNFRDNLMQILMKK